MVFRFFQPITIILDLKKQIQTFQSKQRIVQCFLIFFVIVCDFWSLNNILLLFIKYTSTPSLHKRKETSQKLTSTLIKILLSFKMFPVNLNTFQKLGQSIVYGTRLLFAIIPRILTDGKHTLRAHQKELLKLNRPSTEELLVKFWWPWFRASMVCQCANFQTILYRLLNIFRLNSP